jgi:hypothetical protein
MRFKFQVIFALIFLISTSLITVAGVSVKETAEQAGFLTDKNKCPTGSANCNNKADFSDTGTQIFILKTVGTLLNFAAIIAVVMLVVSGVRLVLAYGNQENIQAAHKQILWTLLGLAVIIFSLLIVRNITELIYKAAGD